MGAQFVSVEVLENIEFLLWKRRGFKILIKLDDPFWP